MRLILVRHGRTTSNVGFLLDTAEPGADLDDTGRQQAISLVERLAGQPIEAIYASNLVRTQQTAAPLAEERGIDIRVLPELREISAGEDEGSQDASRYIDALLRWGAGDLLARVPGGEDAAEFYARFDRAITAIADNGHEVAAVISHGAALRAWAGAKIPGFNQVLGNGHLMNTGLMVVDGSPLDGWVLHELDGAVDYSSGTPIEVSRTPVDVEPPSEAARSAK